MIQVNIIELEIIVSYAAAYNGKLNSGPEYKSIKS